MKYYTRVVFCLLLLFFALPAWAAGPMEDLKGPIQQAIQILQDPKYQDPQQREAQRKAIMSVIRGIFDFNEISKRAVGRRWRQFSQEQQKTFEDTFADFLGHTYYQKVRDAYEGEQVVFLSEQKLGKRKAVVKTNIPRKNGEIPLDYRMVSKKDGWRIYDVIIEGVSMVKNYRTQFSKILSKETPDQLIERLKQKITEQLQQDASS